MYEDHRRTLGATGRWVCGGGVFGNELQSTAIWGHGEHETPKTSFVGERGNAEELDGWEDPQVFVLAISLSGVEDGPRRESRDPARPPFTAEEWPFGIPRSNVQGLCNNFRGSSSLLISWSSS